MKRYFGLFSDYEDFTSQWNGASQITEDQVLIASYEYEGYSGSAFCLYRGGDGKLYEVYESHCSCNGLEDWRPEESNLDALKTFAFSSYGQEFHDQLNEVIRTLKGNS